MHLWCSKGIAPQAQGHERETCLSSFQHSLKRVFELCRYFQTASQRCNPQELMGQAALALGQWGTRASRMGCGLAGIYFSVPGQPCSGAGANMSAEVSCINAATSAAADLPKLKVRCTSQPAPAVAHFSEVPPLFLWYSFGCVGNAHMPGSQSTVRCSIGALQELSVLCV